MQADIDEMIHQATDNETVCDGCVFAYVNPERVSYIVHEAGVSVYLDDYCIGEFRTQSEAVECIGNLMEHYF